MLEEGSASPQREPHVGNGGNCGEAKKDRTEGQDLSDLTGESEWTPG